MAAGQAGVTMVEAGTTPSLFVAGRPRSGGWMSIGPFLLADAAFMRSNSELETETNTRKEILQCGPNH